MTTTTSTTVQIMLQTDADGKPCLNVWMTTDSSEAILWTTGADDLMEAIRYADAISKAKGFRFVAEVIIGVSL